MKERPAWCSRQAGIKAQDQGAGQLVAVQAQSLGSRGAAGSENPGGLGTEARFALQPLARVPRRLHHRRCAAPIRGLRRNKMIGSPDSRFDDDLGAPSSRMSSPVPSEPLPCLHHLLHIRTFLQPSRSRRLRRNGRPPVSSLCILRSPHAFGGLFHGRCGLADRS